VTPWRLPPSSPIGGILAPTATRADATGYQELLEFADLHAAGDRARRCWAVKGTGSYGAGLTAFLHAHGERVARGRPAQASRPPYRRQDRPGSMRSVPLDRHWATNSSRCCHAAAATGKPFAYC
jgi:hypothetical protein